MAFAQANSVVKGPKFNKVGTIAAAGADETDATPVTSGFQIVTGADAAKGVILPEATAVDIGSVIAISNAVAAVLLVYPASGGTINAAAADAALSQNASSLGLYFCTGVDTWVAIEVARAS